MLDYFNVIQRIQYFQYSSIFAPNTLQYVTHWHGRGSGLRWRTTRARADIIALAMRIAHERRPATESFCTEMYLGKNYSIYKFVIYALTSYIETQGIPKNFVIFLYFDSFFIMFLMMDENTAVR